MQLNRRQFVQKASVMSIAGTPMLASLELVSCSERWFDIAASLVPIVTRTVTSLALGPLSLSPAIQALIQGFSAAAQSVLTDIGTDISIAKSDTNVSIIQKLDAEIASLKTQAEALLPQLNVVNPASLQKLKNWIDAITADATDLANLVPIIEGAVGGGAVQTHSGAMVIKERTSLAKARSLKDVFESRLANVQ